jgi:chaperonin GroEL
MTTKQIENNLDRVVKGLNTAADIITSTMGAEGKNVIIQKDGKLRFTKDGVSVAKEINLPDPIENIGAQLLISAANKTVNEVGDGTTLTALMLKTMINAVLEEIQERSINDVLQELEVDIESLVEQIKDKTIQVTTLDEVEKIASTSAKSDVIGKLFKNLYSETGFSAMINIEKSEYSDRTYFEKFTGIEFESGFAHPSFMVNKELENVTYENPYIHIDVNPCNVMTEEYKELLQASYDASIPLIVIAPRYSDSFIRTFSMNKVNQGAQVCLIKTPGYGHGLNKNMDDITSFLNDDGTVDKIVVDHYKFVLYNENPPNVKDRIESLKVLRDNAVEWYDELDYNKRIHKLQGSSAIIYVGGLTKESQAEEFDRIEDAHGAVKSAISNGYSEGGGKTLVQLQTNNKVLSKTLKMPLKTILRNANEPDSIIKEVIAKNMGYNVRTKQFENFLETGIIDPSQVYVQALNNAFTNTKLLINTSFILNNEESN